MWVADLVVVRYGSAAHGCSYRFCALVTLLGRDQPEVFSEQLTAEAGGEARHRVRLSVHGRVDVVVVFDDKGYLGVTVTLFVNS